MNKKTVLFSGAICLLFVGTAELAARLYGLGAPPLSQAHPVIEYYFKPHQNLKRFGNRIFINKFGMRSEDMRPSPSASLQQRVLVFGDSVVFGGSQMDQDLISTSILQKRLREKRPEAEVMNVSAGSWGPGNWRGYGKTYGFFDATDVILVISSHDAYDNPTFSHLNPTTHPVQNPPFALFELVSRYLQPSRIWYQLLGSRLGSSLNREQSAEARKLPNPKAKSGGNISNSEAINIGLADLDAFLIKAKDSGARVAVVQFWERQEVKNGLPGLGHKQIMDVLARHEIRVVQSLDYFRACSDNPARELFVDDIHPYTPAGQKCLADALQSALDEDVK
jgi:hypothetical protein